MSDSPERNELIVHEEVLELGTAVRESGLITARKRVESQEVTETVPRAIEQGQVHREPAGEGDSGEIETLPDGSISIPVLEEELVVTKRVVVRERIVISKQIEIEETPVRAELRRERVEIEETDNREQTPGGG
jgi:uncharacterized protein (TIGR02271 family)